MKSKGANKSTGACRFRCFALLIGLGAAQLETPLKRGRTPPSTPCELAWIRSPVRLLNCLSLSLTLWMDMDHARRWLRLRIE